MTVLRLVSTRNAIGRRGASDGAVHATLDRLERKGLVSLKLGSGTPIRDGRARRYYTVEGAGIRAPNDAREALDNI